MSTTTKASYTQPALIGGAILGALSALPIISAGNLCCCLWVVGGGAVAAYLLQQNQTDPISPGDGTLAGLLAGAFGAVVYLVISIPITILVAPMERVLLQRILENAGGMTPQMREFARTSIGGSFRLLIGFLFMLVVGSAFAAIGGLLGALLFRRRVVPPPASEAPPAG